ncbi:MAG: penicillin-binding protein 2 [Candidatus Woykebacteria bacterium RIFCSPLOWO2_01_FULL_43_14]|uniref:Penicillin-binding protein 2 n=1 Tax=Candidatus Woykebacteria bacterium RIFCSPLOWO2_01_FULL_43_14 TaxID=1802605 RepID=A0A1G1WY40_9BACT|nr:MAG: penicillin-binding protein 2 [Candidatus Woykebacteria bacterium RIFCSPLOWO2_01_FULL_43_14]
MKNLKHLDYLRAAIADQITKYQRKDIVAFDHQDYERGTQWHEVVGLGVNLSEEKLKISKWRLLMLQLLVVAILLSILGRVISLQVISGPKFLAASLANQLRVQIERAPRGVIYDRNGQLLASNTPGFRIALRANELSDPELEKSIKNLATLLKVNEDEIKEKVKTESNLGNVTVAQEVNHELVLNIEASYKDLPGVSVEVSPIRFYHDGPAFAHLLGYTSEIGQEELDKPEFFSYEAGDRIGKSGIELLYEHLLHGKDGQELITVDALGTKNRLFGRTSPTTGEEISLSIDAGLQKVIYEEMEKKMKEVGSSGGAAIAQDPTTGEILALVSIPSYDNNLFAKGIRPIDYSKIISNPNRVLLNRALGALYPPASTFKIFLATAALAEKVIDETTKLEAPSAINLGSAVYKDWKDHGVIDVVRALAESSDTFMYKIGGGHGSQSGLGIDRIVKWAELFGFGKSTQVGLISEADGLVPDENWKREVTGEDWYLGNTYNVAIGQGDMLVTPLQLNNAVVSVANGGRLLKPSLIKGVSGGLVRENFVPKEVLEIVKKGMHEATLPGGTAWPLREFEIPTAGKTGTGEATGKDTKPYAWFTSFAPFEEPSIVVTVVFENAGEGSNVAAPIVRKAYEYWFRDQLKK